MATDSLPLSLGTARFGNVAFGAGGILTSAAAATTNAFQTRWNAPGGDGATTVDQETWWQFPVPANYSSGGTLAIQWMSDVATGAVVWKASIYVATAESSDIDTSSAFNTVETFAVETVPATIGHFKTSALALSSPGLAADRFAILFLGRDRDDGNDTCGGASNLISAQFVYTAT